MLPRSFFALALGLAACASQVGDPALFDEAEAQEAELRTSIGNLTSGDQMCWWDTQPQRSCTLPYQHTLADGRVPTCNTCSCLDCLRGNFLNGQILEVQLREVGMSMDAQFQYEIHDPAELRPYVIVGVGSQTQPTDYEILPIDPEDVIGDSTYVIVPPRFHGQGVYVWFVRNDGGKYSTPLPPSWLAKP